MFQLQFNGVFSRGGGESKHCDVIFDIWGGLTFCDDVWRGGGGSKIGQNRVTSFMDGPIADSEVNHTYLDQFFSSLLYIQLFVTADH